MITRTLGELIDETLDVLYTTGERPKPVVSDRILGPTAQANILSLQLGAEEVSVTDTLEFGSELLLVTRKTDAPNPELTVLRGYAGTPIGTINISQVGRLNPYWTRHHVGRTVRRFFTSVAQVWLPFIESEIFFTAEAGGIAQQLIALPSYVFRVNEVRYQSPLTGRIINVPGWREERNLPPEVTTSTIGLRVPSFVVPADDLIVSYERRYEWVGSGETASITMPDGIDDIPAQWAAAVLATGREMSRLELDKLSEATTEAAARQGSNINYLRFTWQNVYRRIDEARRTLHKARPLVYRRQQKVV